jgi:hypothetical protein
MLNVVMLNVTMMNVVMLDVIVLNVVMLSVIMLNVIMLNVVAPITAVKSFTAPAPAVVILFANSGDKKFPTVRSATDVIKLFTTVIYELDSLAIALVTGKPFQSNVILE